MTDRRSGCFIVVCFFFFFFFQAEDGIRDHCVTGVQTCALPISPRDPRCAAARGRARRRDRSSGDPPPRLSPLRLRETRGVRSEEHTSELQSHSDLVCRLLLEKKKNEKKTEQKNKTEVVYTYKPS